MHPYLLEAVVAARRDEWRDAAARERVVKGARAGRPERPPALRLAVWWRRRRSRPARPGAGLVDLVGAEPAAAIAGPRRVRLSGPA